MTGRVLRTPRWTYAAAPPKVRVGMPFLAADPFQRVLAEA